MREDGSYMDRFERNASRFSARDAVVAVLVAVVVLVVVLGSGMPGAGRDMEPGVNRDIVIALGGPAKSVSDSLPLQRRRGVADAAAVARRGSRRRGRLRRCRRGPGGRSSADAVPLVTADAFDRAAIGAPPRPRRPLRKLLVTGDSLSTPLDQQLARQLSDDGVRVIRDPHLGSGISKTELIDWGRLSVTQAREHKADGVVVFIGANEGFPMAGAGGRDVECCGADWAAVYANRVRRMMHTYRRDGAARVYWITVPTPRDPDRQKIERVVNAAIAVAAQPWRDQVSVVDTVGVFTPGDRYRDAMTLDGRETIVRESDGIHLNERGAALLGERLVSALRRDFEL